MGFIGALRIVCTQKVNHTIWFDTLFINLDNLFNVLLTGNNMRDTPWCDNCEKPMTTGDEIFECTNCKEWISWDAYAEFKYYMRS
tara:strand:- start:1267 stop:1521 length:255 start_codon:yes stop_codon:yes gene_type:complete